jgi:hypothetical protein
MLEDHDGCGRAHDAEYPADDYFVSNQKIQHDARLLRLRHAKNRPAHAWIRPDQRESSDTPN